MQHLVLIPFLFALGACVGSFLNVVVWRLPQIEQDAADGSFFGPFLKTIEGLSNPPSHCPKCGNRLKWYDNIPVLGWIKLRGKCRFCGLPISPRYPIVEAITGLLFVFYYVMFFMAQVGPCAPQPQPVPQESFGVVTFVPQPLTFANHWPTYLLYMTLVAALLAGSLIDAELFIIPIEIPWVLAVAGVAVHALADHPSLPGALSVSPGAAALAAGGGLGLVVSIVLSLRGVFPQSFAAGEPMQDVVLEEGVPAETEGPLVRIVRAVGKILLPSLLILAVWFTAVQRPPVAAGCALALLILAGFWLLGRYPVGFPETEATPPPQDPSEPAREWTRRDLAHEMGKEILFLLPPLLLAIAWWLVTEKVGGVSGWWRGAVAYHWVSGLLGATLGALVGGLVVWVTRILGTFGFGRLAMGLGDVHLMFGVGAVVGAACSTIAFFLAPFFGIATAVYLLVSGKRREIPYGPYLSMATAFVLLFCCPIVNWLSPGMEGLRMMVGGWMGGR